MNGPSIGSRFRFRLGTIFWFTLVACLALAWYVDHRRQVAEIKRLQPAISTFWEKHHFYSPSIHLHCETSEIESRLAGRVPRFEGVIVKSRQGMSEASLRRPNSETLDAVIDLVSDSDTTTIRDATRLLALYLEAFSGSRAFEPESKVAKQHFQVRGISRVKALLKHPSTDVRQAAALVLGNTLPIRSTVEHLSSSFDDEVDSTTKLYLAWSYYTLTQPPR